MTTKATPQTSEQYSLTPEEIFRFHRDGYLGPFTAFSPEEMAPINRAFHEAIFPSTGPNPANSKQCRHLDTAEGWAVVSHPAIVGRLASLLGADLMVWGSGFFIKEPNTGAGTEWHQDINFWPIEPPLNITAWVATERVTEKSSPLRIIPGSHTAAVPHRKVGGLTLGEEADPAFFDESKAVYFPMEAGQFVIFVERVLHGAPPNTADHRRCGMPIRYTVPFVRLFPDKAPINFPNYRALMVSGEDRFGFNPLGTPPC